MSKRVCVIGGGISGLCVAYRLKRSGVDVTLFEKSESAGGSIKTVIRDGFLYEHGPNSALASRELLDLIGELGLSEQIAVPNPNAKNRLVVRGGKLAALPSSISSFINSRTFTVKAKIRLLKEPFVPAGSNPGESVAQFFERRLGKEIVDYAVDPFISGIYAGDPQKLSIEHAFPKLYHLEQKHGSILRGALFSKKDKAVRLPKGTPRSITFKNGMQTLSDALAGKLGASLRLETSVNEIRGSLQNRYVIKNDSGDEKFDAVVVSTPARAAARLTAVIDAGLSKTLDGIYYAPVSVVITAFKCDQVTADAAGFGFLVPGVENRRILGSLWTSSVFENRAPDGYHIFTTFIGGSRGARLCELSDSEIVTIVLEELDSILGISGEPVFSVVKKWERAIPQYNIGYEKVTDAIEKFQSNNRGFFFCSNFYKGISVGDCVKNSAATAADVLEFL